MIDIYDIVNSDFANNIDDMQDAFFTIKNYNGQDLQEFLTQLKKFKAVPVGDGGDVTANQLTIPTEAREKFLSLTDENIYKFAMAVDTNKLAGSSLTTTAIKASFANLDLKADKFEAEFRKFIRTLITFINKYEGTSYSYDFTLDRSMLVNNIETIEAIKNQKGIISDRTLFENHPLVLDVDQEFKRIEEESEPIELDDELTDNSTLNQEEQMFVER
jgi:SPP1 family phage portal protein